MAPARVLPWGKLADSTSHLAGLRPAGVLVLNAQRVTDSSGEAFAVRLFRSGNARGYVRAFSDTPMGFGGGFNKVSLCGHVVQ